MRVMMLAAMALFLGACASSEPSIQQGPDAETSFDGLVRIDNSAFSHAWVDPDIDLKSYNKVMAGGAEFEFRAVDRTATRSTMRSNNSREFWISDGNRARLIETVSTVFREELASSKHFTVTDTAGPDTLILTGGLHDIVSQVPPEFIGRGEIYLSSVGEATLVLELRDSLSGKTIYRAVDRRRIERPGGQMFEATTVTTWAEVRRWARRWATRLVNGLDSIHQ